MDHKQLKSQLNDAKLEHTWLEADFSKLKKEYQQLDITSTKLTNQCEVWTCSKLIWCSIVPCNCFFDLITVTLFITDFAGAT